MNIVLSEDLTSSCPSMLTAVQCNILPSSFIFPVYVSTLDDITLSSLQSVLQTSGCGEAEVVIFVLDKYHCILLDGRAAFVLQANVWSLFEITSTGFLSVGVDKSVADDIGTETKWWHLTIDCLAWFLYCNLFRLWCYIEVRYILGYLKYPVKIGRHNIQTFIL
jgi:hypothetical protein